MVNEKEIQESIEKAEFKQDIHNLVEKRLLQVIKCGKGPSTGYVDGVKYQKDNKQRFYEVREPNRFAEKGYISYYECHNGDIENKQIEAQDNVDWSEDEQRAFTSLAENMEDTVGYDLHGEHWGDVDRIADISDDSNIVFGADDDGFPSGAQDWYEDDRDNYVVQRVQDAKTIERMFKKAPGLQGDTQLFTLDIPNPDLKEGDVFELDTFMSATFKEAQQGTKYNSYPNSSIDTNIDRARNMLPSGDTHGLVETDYRKNSTNWRGEKQGDTLPFNDAYKITIMGSDGTPVLINQGEITNSRANTHYPVSVGYKGQYDFDANDYWEDYPTSPHDVFLNKGQKMRVVRIDHEKKTAIYQTVDG